MRPDRKRDVFSLPEGEIIFEWPATLSAESYELVREWIEIMGRKLARAVEAKR